MRQDDLLSKLSTFGQQHLAKYLDELDENERDRFVSELDELNLEQLNQAFVESTRQHPNRQQSSVHMEPVPTELKGVYATSSNEQLGLYEREGLRAIANNEVAVILLAGGQGTRLGVDYPKGMYSVGLLSGKSLFQLQAERLLKLKSMAAAISVSPSSSPSKSPRACNNPSLPWYIMVSERTLESTQSFFDRNGYFGLDRSDVMFFEQSTMPCFFKDGRIILDGKSTVSRSPDGNGGLYKAIRDKGVLDDLIARGVKYVHVYCVDNILVKVADPVFTGFSIIKQLNCGSKVVKKVHPEESVGVICKRDGIYQVVEYSEISEDMRNLRQPNGDLVYNAGNICNHFFTTEFLDSVCRYHENELEYHVASKKIPFLNEEGVLEKPLAENGIKLEKFIFDVFKFSNAEWAKGNFGVWEVLREEEFAPLKNSDSVKSDNPRTCRESLMRLHANWLKNSGAKLDSQSKSPQIEISPLVSYNGEGLDQFVQGQEFSEPLLVEKDLASNRPLFNGTELERSSFNWRYSKGYFVANINYN